MVISLLCHAHSRFGAFAYVFSLLAMSFPMLYAYRTPKSSFESKFRKLCKDSLPGQLDLSIWQMLCFCSYCTIQYLFIFRLPQ